MTNSAAWYAAKWKCRCCTGEHVSVFPEEAPQDELQCHFCMAQDSEIVEFVGPDGMLQLLDADEIEFFEERDE